MMKTPKWCTSDEFVRRTRLFIDRLIVEDRQPPLGTRFEPEWAYMKIGGAEAWNVLCRVSGKPYVVFEDGSYAEVTSMQVMP